MTHHRRLMIPHNLIPSDPGITLCRRSEYGRISTNEPRIRFAAVKQTVTPDTPERLWIQGVLYTKGKERGVGASELET